MLCADVKPYGRMYFPELILRDVLSLMSDLFQHLSEFFPGPEHADWENEIGFQGELLNPQPTFELKSYSKPLNLPN